MKTQPVWIGFIGKDLKFCSVYTIYRPNIKDSLRFRGEVYKCVNTEWGCYIPEAEYNKLFNP